MRLRAARRYPLSVLIGAVLLTLSLVPAQNALAARGEKGDWELGLFIGYASLDDYERDSGLSLSPQDDVFLGGRVGYFFNPSLSLETSIQRLATQTDFAGTDSETNVDLDSVRLNLLYNIKGGRFFVPYLTVGVGYEAFDASPVYNSGDPSANAGAGLRWFVGRTFGIRLDARYIYVDADSPVSGAQSNIEASLGATWAFGGGPPADEDGDGVPDKRDNCPGTPRGALVDEFGCPIDSDGDGVPDGIDRCPDTPRGAKVDAVGCPVDSDGDGVWDGLDQCPGTPAGAVVDQAGCPVDSDGDDVADGIDQCPDTPRGARVDPVGCPIDSDGDGVPDGIDRCPDTPRGAKVDAVGCPIDTDGDSVPDGIDQCPGTRPGVQVNSVGCEVLFEQGRDTLVLKGVNFAFDSAALTSDSKELLDSVAVALKQAAEVKIEIAGHTDSKGNDGYNMKLSQRRADSVRNYLVGQGVDGARLTAKGYGETQPLADNATDAGRAQNRRVVLRKL